jgi:hypothetical protein
MATIQAPSARLAIAVVSVFGAVLGGQVRSDTAVPTPKVTGPIASTASPGDASHNYPFFSMRAEVSARGFQEDEFFVEGQAQAYSDTGPTSAAGTPDAGGPYAYKTRVIVRRPVSAARFNGTVILEWINVASGVDQENDWWWSHEHLMRAGYAYVGVSAQARGLDSPTGLKVWNRSRYGSLDVNASGKFMFQLSYDIYSQVAQALKRPDGTRLVGDLGVRNVIATGHSSSAGRLSVYYNVVHSTAGIIDGFVLHGLGPQLVRTDIRTPAWKLLAEGDVERVGVARQPDAEYLRTWEVAGAAHADWDLVRVIDPLTARDVPATQTKSVCDRPPFSRVPSRLVQHAVYDGMKVWIEKGAAPPHAPPITLVSADSAAQGTRRAAVRDALGHALGGIRLAAIDVPTATNTGVNSGEQYCGIFGSHVPFDTATLARLYPTHAAYVTAVERVTDDNLKAGYITKVGADEIKQEAARSSVGTRP